MGTSGDAFLPIVESVKIYQNRCSLREIPNKASGVTVMNGATPISINDSGLNQLPNTTTVSIDYNFGFVYTDPSFEGLTLQFTYQGSGISTISANRVWTLQSGGTITQTLADITSAATQFTYIGTYDNAIQYRVYNMVNYLGTSYMCTATSIGNLPTNTSFFKKIAGNNYQGVYSASATYVNGDYVINATSDVLYVSIVDGNIGQTLTNTAKWTPTISVASITAAEASRVTAESGRVTSESGRVTAESTRVSNETTRGTNETNRGTAETTRNTNETTRQSQESTRVSQESARVTKNAAITFLGAYNNATNYVVGNQVNVSGTTYTCTAPTVGNTPPNTTYWAIFAASGSVTSVTSANTDISVATGTTTPVITVNTGQGGNQIPKRDTNGIIQNVGYQITSKSANATLLLTESGIIDVTTAASTITITLPSAVTTQVSYLIKKIDSGAGTVTIATTSSQLIDGVSTKSITGQNNYIQVVSDGTGWQVVDSSTATSVPASGVTGMLPIANGGTGSATQNFVDLTTAQTIAGEKTLTGGTLTLSNATSNLISFINAGTGNPVANARSSGAKINLLDDVSQNYGIGIEAAGNVWHSSYNAHKWYSQGAVSNAVPTVVATLDGLGNMTIARDLTAGAASFSGIVTVPTATETTNNNQSASTAYVTTNVGIKSNLTTTTKTDLVSAINETRNYSTSDITRQSIINGNFSINQRAVSGTVTLAAGVYGHDRWKAGASGCTYTFATSLNVTTITITTGSLIQVIEGVNLFSGTYTLSWTGTAQGKIGAGSFGATGITGTAVGGTNLSIEFNVGTLSKVQFNIGSIALQFQPKNYNQENLDSLRFRWQSWADGVVSPATGSFASYALTTNALVINARFPVPMRIAPTITVQNNNVANQVRNSSTNAAVAATLSTTSGQSNKGLSIMTFAGTPFTTGQYYDFDIVADAEI